MGPYTRFPAPANHPGKQNANGREREGGRMPSQAVVREATPADREGVVALRLAAYGALRSRYPTEADFAAHMEELRHRETPGTLVLVAEVDDRLVGTVTLMGPEFRFLAVDADAQRTGVGRRLVEEAVRRGARSLLTTPWMTEARRLYERMGFTRRPDRDEGYGLLELLSYDAPPPSAGADVHREGPEA